MPDKTWGVLRPLGVLGLCLALAACVTPRYPVERPTRYPARPRPPEAYAPPFRAPIPAAPMRLSSLTGWTYEDHAAALAAFAAGCRVTKDTALYDLCHEARARGPLGEDEARAFLEANFRAAPLEGEGLLTGYFVPEYEASEIPVLPFIAPVRPRPADLPSGGVYADRAAIEAEEAPDALAWMRPEDLFFMQIQGSGVLDFPDGHRLKASFAGSNGQPFTAVAVPLRERGELPAAASGAQDVRTWLADHRGPEADAVMDLNRRYVFFQVAPDDGRQPVGTAGLMLTPGRSIAVDPSLHPMGGLYWIDADSPSLHGAAADYRRLAMALDTGGAIKGQVRADLYVGRGQAAGVEAGHIRHALKLYQLIPAREATP